MALHPIIANRWSARGFDSTTTISTEQLDTLLDAARWAPTWGKMQPVRFIVGRRGDDTFATLAETLTDGNAPWAPNAAALVLMCTRNIPDDDTLHTYGAVDLGIALGQLIMQAVADGLSAHPMAGFDSAAAVERFTIPATERPLVLVAVGTLAADEDKDPAAAKYDHRERGRLPLPEVAFANQWGTPYQ